MSSPYLQKVRSVYKTRFIVKYYILHSNDIKNARIFSVFPFANAQIASRVYLLLHFYRLSRARIFKQFLSAYLGWANSNDDTIRIFIPSKKNGKVKTKKRNTKSVTCNCTMSWQIALTCVCESRIKKGEVFRTRNSHRHT